MLLHSMNIQKLLFSLLILLLKSQTVDFICNYFCFSFEQLAAGSRAYNNHCYQKQVKKQWLQLEHGSATFSRLRKL